MRTLDLLLQNSSLQSFDNPPHTEVNMPIQYAQVQESVVSYFNGDYRNYSTVHGYAKRCGVPTNFKVQLYGSKRWYRVKSFNGTLFVATKEDPFLVVHSWDVGYDRPHFNSK